VVRRQPATNAFQIFALGFAIHIVSLWVHALVKLPHYPFRVSEVDDSHPFVKEALRPRKPHERCWCGSGKKYQNCHRFRHEQRPLTLGQIRNRQKDVFWRPRGCMHPNASPTTCRGRVIDAHSIQRKGPLAKLIDASNHVCHLDAPAAGSDLVVSKIGWRKASTFPGYCALHDSEIFAELERGPFAGSHEQCVLQAFRDVCNELYKKQALLDTLAYQRDVIDLGCNVDDQITRQLSIAENIAGQQKSKSELLAIWHKFNDVVVRSDYGKFQSRTFPFEGDFAVASSGALHAEFDLSGQKLIDMWDTSVDAEMLCHSIQAKEKGGTIVLTWLTDEKAPARVVASFEAISDEDKGDIFVQYCFLNSENTFFSDAWWLLLAKSQQETLKRYAALLFYEGGAFVANHPPLVRWTFERHA
jgi:hypothetical protein